MGPVGRLPHPAHGDARHITSLPRSVSPGLCPSRPATAPRPWRSSSTASTTAGCWPTKPAQPGPGLRGRWAVGTWCARSSPASSGTSICCPATRQPGGPSRDPGRPPWRVLAPPPPANESLRRRRPGPAPRQIILITTILPYFRIRVTVHTGKQLKSSPQAAAM
jgi:hypothetical protein